MKDKWIKVSDRLPEVNPLWEEWNLVRLYYNGTYLLEILQWNGVGWYNQGGERIDRFAGVMITHWMPIELPESVGAK